ncbi:MAG: sulfurtransferase TusA family protein [Candidatus Mariimomonas ferrooxydans]
MADLKSQTPTQTVDVMGRVCPYPLVMAKKAVEKASPGSLIKVLCDAPASAEDTIPNIVKKTDWNLRLSDLKIKATGSFLSRNHNWV